MQIVEGNSRKTSPISLGDGLSIYKQPKSPGRGSPNWYARIRIKHGNRGVHIKTTGTSDEKIAKERARQFMTDILVQQRTGVAMADGTLSDRPFRFDVIADSFLDDLQESAAGDRRRLRRYHDHRRAMIGRNGMTAFFRRTDVRSITKKTISDFLEFAEREGRKGTLKPTTKRNVLSSLRAVLNHAVDLGLLSKLPVFPTIPMKDSPRPSFTTREYKILRVGCQSLVRYHRLTGDDWLLRQFEELHDFVPFMVNSFLRPSEWRDLRHRDIEVVVGKYTFLRIHIRNGKTGQRKVVTMPGAVRDYRRVVERNGADPDAFVFLPEYGNRNTALERMRDRFKDLLDLVGLEADGFDRPHVLYSLRHTALTLRVLNGDNVDRMILARNAGTSVEMLERFYCSDLEPEAKIANLQSFKK